MIRTANSSLTFITKSGLRGLSCAASNKVAVILSGCGVFDGTELHEASATLVHLTRLNYVPVCYAPDVNQMHVIDHSKGAEAAGERNVLSESARIARGNIKNLAELNGSEVVAAVFPGGFGAAKNLSNFATAGADISVIPEVSRVVHDLHKRKRPMAFICISPILAARLLPKVQVTLGQTGGDEWPHAGAIDAAKAVGAQVELCDVNQVCVDKRNLVLSTPAFMFNGQFHEIFDGIGNLIQSLDCMIRESK